MSHPMPSVAVCRATTVSRRGFAASLVSAVVALLGCGFSEKPPNILLIVVDTLRADHLGCYGYERPTSPHIDKQLAARGVVIEDAYAQAPWTTPSMASVLTGHMPAAMLDENGEPWGIPAQAETVAERLLAAGYETAAFVANPTLREGNGFAQGFGHFWTAPPERSALERHADDLNAKILPWLEQSPQAPFFLYAHYLDPHDPYDNPDLVDGRSPFYPDYAGPVRGGDVHGLYLGALEMASPSEDLAHLTALYDSEILYADRAIDELLAAIPEEVLADTLVVLISDHGEELYEHGGFKHGETLYQELIHVPFLARWDGRLPAPSRLQGTVRLLDLAPTLLAAAGVPAEDLPGVDLLPALRGDEPLPELGAFARHHSGGPLRAAWVEADHKVILFDRFAPFEPRDERERGLWKRDVERLQRLEGYGPLRVDRQESILRNRVPEPRQALIWGELDRWEDGLRIVASGLAEEASLSGELRFDAPIGATEARFLGPEDRFEVDGKRLSFTWHGDGVIKGLRLVGGFARIESVALSLDGAPLAPTLLPAGPYADGPIDLRQLLVDDYPPTPIGPALRLWARRAERPWPAGARDDDTYQSLQALGYVGD